VRRSPAIRAAARAVLGLVAGLALVAAAGLAAPGGSAVGAALAPPAAPSPPEASALLVPTQQPRVDTRLSDQVNGVVHVINGGASGGDWLLRSNRAGDMNQQLQDFMCRWWGPGQAGPQPTGYQCAVCAVLHQLVEAGYAYSRRVSAAFAEIAVPFSRALALLAVVWLGLRMVVWDEGGAALLRAWRSTLFWIGGVAIALQVGWTGVLVPQAVAAANPTVFDWIFDTLQLEALAISSFTINVGMVEAPGATVAYLLPASSAAENALATGYTALWSVVETAVLPFVRLLFTSSFLSFAWIPGFVLAAPYVFVAGMFLSYLLQSAFYFVAIPAVSPLLVALMIFPATRGFAWAGLRVLFTGALTVVMASIAMGFTAYAMQVGGRALVADLAGCEQLLSFSGLVTSGGYWAMFLIGFLSILLHLAAPRLAANIGGASDSAAGAAGVVAGAQFAAARAIGAGRTAALGTGQPGGAFGVLGEKGVLGVGASAAAGSAGWLGGAAGGALLGRIRGAMGKGGGDAA
jgi:hypothetical protein